ncbi:MAG TPA: FHA domain-containing protein [Gemmatimonadaceae bacterium]|nr:FHA domain-containing protein [Gemmatimonadaceae bacterium]
MSVSLVNIGIIVGLLAIGLAITLVVVRILRRRRDIALRRHGAPVLVMPVAGPEVSAAPRPAIARDEWPQDRVSPRAVRRITPRSPTSVRNITPFIPEPVASEPDVLIVPDEDHVTTSTGPFRPSEARSGSPSAHLVEGAQVRFFRAEEGTLEFLPGRLEVVQGEDVGQEIHFVRQVGDDDVTITFGRSEGPPLRHVQLLDPTVSRQHARMTYTGHWQLSNLSTTNAVLLNGSSLPSHGAGVTLQDGDRLEMGAVMFVFHAR